MTVRDVADLLFTARGRIDFYWNFYVVVVIAVIGWLVSLRKTLTPSLKTLVSVAYVIASAMNLLGLYSAYTFAEALRTDLLRMVPDTTLPDTRRILEQHSYLSQRLAACVTHIAVGAAVLLVLWFGRFPEPEAATGPAAPDRPGPAGDRKDEPPPAGKRTRR
jgi:hypothetical protein